MIKIKTLKLGELSTNCYIVYNENEKFCAIIDPADNEWAIRDYLEANSLTPMVILLTHGHYDHFGAAEALKAKYNTSIFVSYLDEDMLYDPELNGSLSFSSESVSLKDTRAITLIPPDISYFFEDIGLRIMYTPGHSKGSLSYLISGNLFSGDLIFEGGGYGRTDLYGGDLRTIVRSIKEVMTLPPNTVVYPGHGESFLLKDYR